jgi:hypothetical protein
MSIRAQYTGDIKGLHIPRLITLSPLPQLHLMQLRNPLEHFEQQSRATILAEEFGTGGVAADVHCAELGELPAVEVGRAVDRVGGWV